MAARHFRCAATSTRHDSPGQDFPLATCLLRQRLENQEDLLCFLPEYKLHLLHF